MADGWYRLGFLSFLFFLASLGRGVCIQNPVKHFAKTVNGYKKCSILDIWQGSEYAAVRVYYFWWYILRH